MGLEQPATGIRKRPLKVQRSTNLVEPNGPEGGVEHRKGTTGADIRSMKEWTPQQPALNLPSANPVGSDEPGFGKDRQERAATPEIFGTRELVRTVIPDPMGRALHFRVRDYKFDHAIGATEPMI
jgi:hypothetical protein